MVAWVLAEALAERFGHDRLDVMLAACRSLAGADVPLGGRS
jgi:hypothetical protein